MRSCNRCKRQVPGILKCDFCGNYHCSDCSGKPQDKDGKLWCGLCGEGLTRRCYQCDENLDNWEDHIECDDCGKPFCPPCSSDGSMGGDRIGHVHFTCRACDDNALVRENEILAESLEIIMDLWMQRAVNEDCPYTFFNWYMEGFKHKKPKWCDAVEGVVECRGGTRHLNGPAQRNLCWKNYFRMKAVEKMRDENEE